MGVRPCRTRVRALGAGAFQGTDSESAYSLLHCSICCAKVQMPGSMSKLLRATRLTRKGRFVAAALLVQQVLGMGAPGPQAAPCSGQKNRSEKPENAFAGARPAGAPAGQNKCSRTRGGP